jgi:hypothetical protein
MAYVDRQHEIIILYPHKTGTHTIRQIITDAGREAGTTPEGHFTNHPSLEQVKEWNPDITNIYDWDVYAFYRDPIEKFLSFMEYKYIKEPYHERVPILEYHQRLGSFVPQTRWIYHPRVQVKLLDFRRFEDQLRHVLKRVGIFPETIPVLNASGNSITPADLTTEETEHLKLVYKKDYDYLASRGITFP